MAYSVQAATKVFDYITQKIKSREWLPGTKIATENQLCEQMDVSRIAVRQAVEKLSALMVLRKVQGSGTYVEEYENVSLQGLFYYPVDKNTMTTVLEFRRMFDSYNTELYIGRCTQDDVEKLEKNYNAMKMAVNDRGQFRYLDNEFHSLISRGTRNPIIIQVSNLLTDLLIEHQNALYHNVGPDHAIEYHGIILENIKVRNPELASIYARMHIENALKVLSGLREEDIQS